MPQPANYFYLIVALPNPGEPGSPHGMFYPAMPEGEKLAEEFSKQQDRPGWGVFECVSRFREASWDAFNEVVQHALEHPPS